MAIKNAYLQKVYDKVVARDPDQALFHQAVREFLESLGPDDEHRPSDAPLFRRGFRSPQGKGRPDGLRAEHAAREGT